MIPESKELISKLGLCVHVCNECHEACLGEEDVKMMAKCIRLDRECSVICAATLQLVYKGGRFKKEMLMICKNACLACAEECQKHRYDHCQCCADVCRECAKACEAMLNRKSSGPYNCADK